MDESVLWAAAIGIALLGLVLLAVGTLAAVYWGAATNDSGKSKPQAKSTSSAGKRQSQAGGAASASKFRQRLSSSEAQQPVGGGFLPWVRAWIFAFIHASTVGLVLGGITFFEDMAKANDEILRTGTVSFPKQLLPGTLTGSTVRERLSRPAGGLLERGEDDETSEEPQQSDESPSNAAGWEVVDVLDEAEAGDD
ncbi:MAG: hypothetical protein DRJ03_11605 [Chloroflexi bacterium]|nr:MAG: hypothetical protein DRJ03_11605 [Chloroflexota bacterium]